MSKPRICDRPKDALGAALYEATSAMSSLNMPPEPIGIPEEEHDFPYPYIS